MPAYRATVSIGAPPERVFPLIADLSRHPAWSADPLEVATGGEGRATSVARSKGKTIEAALTTVTSEPPSTFVFDAEDLTGRWRHTFTLTPDGDGTLVERRIEGRLSGAQLLLFWVVLLPVKKPNARRALERLKALVERGDET